MNILLLSAGGGGGNILRSLKTWFRRDLAVAQKSDPRYADRLRRAVTTRFLDTNEFSLTDVPSEERLLIGAATTRRLGSMHDPKLARAALEESRAEVEALIKNYSLVVIIGTGGKGTGAGTLFPLAEIARQQRRLVIPIFVRPSFEWHEVEKRRYDHALGVVERFDSAKIRILEILNDRGYSSAEPQPQATVWDRMNHPIARGLRGLLYVLWDLSQVDPSDLSMLFAGHGRLRLGFGELNPPAGREPTDDQIEQAVRSCWENSYYAFTQPVGTSLVCIQGHWSNVVDGRIKARLATLALSGASDSSYNPLYARASHAPRPWGITALFAEDTGKHSPLDIEWPFRRVAPEERKAPAPLAARRGRPKAAVETPLVAVQSDAHMVHPGRSFSTFWEFALAVNRADPSAVVMARNGVECEIAIDPSEVRKLLATLWFRSVFSSFSEHWRSRILEALLSDVKMPDHLLRDGRRTARVSQLTYDQLKEVVTDTVLPEAVRTDIQFLLAVAMFWGADALERVAFAKAEESTPAPKVALWPVATAPSWLGRFRRGVE